MTLPSLIGIFKVQTIMTSIERQSWKSPKNPAWKLLGFLL